MAITMKNYRLTWTDTSGVPRVSVPSYDKASAERRKERLQGDGCTDVQVVETKPGEVLQPQA
ncbi:hypothetical protein [Streptomyces sp. NPDC050704]|uniref:hypothetical protein n=1 Tax=Streptomyces sp. NPDC050704 TaxID=3157219 RepID=UPI003436FDCE